MGYFLVLFNWIIFIIEVSRTISSVVRELSSYMISFVRPPLPKDMKDKVVVVTGAATRLGSEISHRFARLGAQVIMLDVDEEANLQAANELRRMGNKKVFSFPCDVTVDAQVSAVAAKILKFFGRVDILVHNATWWEPTAVSPLIQSPSEAIHRTINVNLLSHFWMTRAFLPSMIERRSGHVVAISSPSGLIGNSARFSSFCASQHAIVGAMSALAAELEAYPSIKLCIACCPVTVVTATTDTSTVTTHRLRLPSAIRRLLGLELPTLREQAAVLVDGIRSDKEYVVVPKGFVLLQFLEQSLIDVRIPITLGCRSQVTDKLFSRVRITLTK
ncbi:short-chain dehydrogenase/reductase family 16C member 6-like isoform X2 [Varroa jacobsoni]|uniref:short-chain dehydrogenase/reductase family 16C member 6-like isoform X2 n=1 Tax=Varroa jacobsoni TaxID=62625 RepID=UPI000BF6AC34|nr:short-chain dehydrogenase/reductase family 16C member 6-like isoform X2 [Varroa jacobsoni]